MPRKLKHPGGPRETYGGRIFNKIETARFLKLGGSSDVLNALATNWMDERENMHLILFAQAKAEAIRFFERKAEPHQKKAQSVGMADPELVPFCVMTLKMKEKFNRLSNEDIENAVRLGFMEASKR